MELNIDSYRDSHSFEQHAPSLILWWARTEQVLRSVSNSCITHY